MSEKYEKYTKEILEKIVAESFSIAEVLRKLGLRLSGGNHSHISRKVKKLQIDAAHFSLRHKEKPTASHAYVPWQRRLINRTGVSDRRAHAAVLRRALLESGRAYICVACTIERWQNKAISLEINHKNANWLDDTPENLEFLCPNCHSQTYIKQGFDPHLQALRNSPEWKRSTELTPEDRKLMFQLRDTGSSYADIADAIGSHYKVVAGILKHTTRKFCMDCQRIISITSSGRCKSCAAKSRGGKIAWLPADELLARLEHQSYLELGRELGVSDNAIRKHLRNRGITPPKKHLCKVA